MRAFRILVAGGFAALAISATPVLAADYLRGTQTEAPAPEWGKGPVTTGLDWSGFYAGGHGGWSRTRFDPNTSLQTLASQPLRQTTVLSEYNPPGWIQVHTGDDNGMSFGALAGYNMMFGDVMFGLEVDYTHSNQSFSGVDAIARRVSTSDGNVNDISLTSTQAMRLKDYLTGRARFGVAYGRFMPFATVGAAVGRFDMLSSVLMDYQIQPGGVGPFLQATGFPVTVSENRRNVYGFGLTAGAGLDIALMDNLFLRAEYQFIRFGDVKGAVADVNTLRAAAAVKF